MATDKVTKDTRRSNKPIMEKRRRARINNCLNDLKTLILEAMKKDPARHSKLEKADILEMTVKYLQNLQRQQVAYVATTDPNVINKYRAGFSECANEVSRYISRLHTIDPKIRSRLLNHLSGCLSGLVPSTSSRLPLSKTETAVVSPVHIQIPNAPVNLLPPTVDVVSGIQLVPSRLANGEIAFLIPASTTFSNRPISPSFTVSSNASTLSPAGSDFSDVSCVSSPSPLMAKNNLDMPQNLTVPKNSTSANLVVESENVWRPW